MSITEAIILGAVALGLIVSLTLVWLHSRALRMDLHLVQESRAHREALDRASRQREAGQ